MKKLITFLIAFAAATAFVSAKEENKEPSVEVLTERLEKVIANLEKRGDSMPPSRKALLENQVEMLELKIKMGEEVNAALAELGDDASEQETKKAEWGVRKQYKDKLKELNTQRKKLLEEDKANS